MDKHQEEFIAIVAQVFQDIELGVEDEIGSIRIQVEQIKQLLVDAIAALHDGFQGVNNDSSQQMALISVLMAQTVKQDDHAGLNIFQRTEDAGKILTNIVEMLMSSSRNNLRALETMDALNSKMVKVADGMEVSKSIFQEMESLATSDDVDMQKMQELIRQAGVQHQASVNGMHQANRSFVETHKLIDEVASGDMDDVFASKGQVEEILKHFYEINDLISSCRADLTQVNGSMRQNLGKSVRALQFEDIVSQSLGHTSLHLDRMEGFVMRLAQGLSSIDTKELNGFNDYAVRITGIHAEMMMYKQELALDEKNPVTQTNMDEGDVELF
ncbi:MAG: hypothetical protein R8M45_02750 [Ghiorsea sp.]